MTLLLALIRRVPAMLEEQAKRNWSRLGVSAKATSVEGKVMAIVGYGQIGRQIACARPAFGIRTIASRARASPTTCWMRAARCPSWIRRSRAPTS